MIESLKKIFKRKATRGPEKYKGFSDFFLHAPDDEKKKVITEAARRSNEDQLKVFDEARLKMKAN